MKTSPSTILRVSLSAGALLAALLPVSAALVTSYGAFKILGHEQTGPVPANPPALTEHGFFAYAVASEADALLLATVSAGSSLPQFLSPAGDDPLLLEAEAEFGTAAELDAALPNGNLAFQFIDSSGGILNSGVTLAGNAYPAAPALKNFTAGQDLDRAQPFTLQWDKPSQLDAADYVIVEVEADGETVVDSPAPWEAGALPGTTTSFTVPANVLPTDAELVGRIIFVNVTATETADIAGATGFVGNAAATEFPLKLRGSGTGGGGDTTPPILAFTTPFSGAMGVAANVAVVFTFNEAMQPVQNIAWTGVANSASFTYSWSGDGTKLTCTYPGGFTDGATVTWLLNPVGFKDVAGNLLLALQPAQLTGSFTVGSGGTGGCGNDLTQRGDTFFIARFANFLQTSAAAPVPGAPAGDPVAAFFANFSPLASNPIGAEVGLPGGQTRPLSQLGNLFLSQKQFATEAALDAEFGAGNYLARLTTAGGTGTLTVNLGAAPATPHCANYPAAQAINAAADFALAWDAFTGAGANDRIELIIHGDQGNVLFRRPDECAVPPKPLAATATGVTIPAGTLQAGKTYAVELNFFKLSGSGTNASPAFTALGGYSKTTRFNVAATGGAANIAPVITAARIAADLRFEADVTASPGRTLTLEATSDYAVWSPVGNATVPASGKATVRDTRTATAAFQAYRVRSE